MGIRYERANYTNAASVQAVEDAGLTMSAGKDIDLVEERLKMDHAIGTNLSGPGLEIEGTAGATIAIGEVCYLQDTDNEWLLTDADAEASSKGMLGIAVTAGTDGSTFQVMILMGIFRADALYGFTTGGAPLYLSTTPGAITGTAPSGSGDIVRIVGYAHDDGDTIIFRPGNTFVEIA
jgi:hypothetical protein